MIRFEDIPFGPTSATVEAPDLQDALDEIGKLTRLHQDARMLEAHVRHFYDVEPHVVPIARIDQEGHRYRGFRCLNTNCDITFKEEQGGQVWPGRYCAYLNGDNRPKLWDPNYSYEEILDAVGPETEYIRRFRVNVGEAGATPGRPPQGAPSQQAPPQEAPPNPAPPQGSVPPADDSVPAGEYSGRNGSSGEEEAWNHRLNDVESKIKQLPMAERPDMMARIADWTDGLSPSKRSDVWDILDEYQTDEPYDARLEELEDLVANAEEPGAVMQNVIQEVRRWPKKYREAARLTLEPYAPDDVDVGTAVHSR